MHDALALDHLLYAVPDLERAQGTLADALGARPAAGGRHEGLGTHNAILPLAVASQGPVYLELIAPDPEAPAPAGPRPFGLDDLEEPRLVTWAVRSRDIEGDVQRARAAGYDPGRVLPMSRRRPDGTTVRWKLSLRAEPFGDGLVPFVIDWKKAPHPGDGPSACSLLGLRGEHPHPAPIQAALRALDASLAIRTAPEAALVAGIVGPRGKLELR